MKTYQSQLHIKETYVDSVYGRIFEGWMTGAGLNAFGSLADTQCAMTSSQAIAHKCAVEKHAFEISEATWLSQDGLPVQNEFKVETVFDFLK